MSKVLMTVAEVAEVLRCQPDTITRLIAGDHLPGYPLPRPDGSTETVVLENDLIDYVATGCPGMCFLFGQQAREIMAAREEAGNAALNESAAQDQAEHADADVGADMAPVE